MATLLSTIRSEVRSRLGNKSTTNLSNARMDFAIKAAIMQLSSPKVHRQADLERKISVSTVSGTDTISLGTTVWTIFSGRDTTSTNIRRLEAVGPQYMDELEKSSGRPLSYCRWGDDAEVTSVELDPIPNGVYALVFRCYIFPQFTVDGNGELSGNCPLREVYDEGIMLGAEYRLWFNALQNPKRGMMVKNQLADWVESIVTPYEGELDDQTVDSLAPSMGIFGARG